MAGELTFKIGTKSVKLELTATNPQLESSLIDYLEEMKLSTEGTQEERMLLFLAHIQARIRKFARSRRQKKLEASARANALQQLEPEEILF